MPTTRPRYQLTETDELRNAIERAAKRWPEDAERPSRLILRLIKAGNDALAAERERRLRAVEATAGKLTGVWPAGAIGKLRDEWPD